ncbi:MAG: hypothetical protein ACLGIR_12890 [Actinomycetes bacterium]
MTDLPLPPDDALAALLPPEVDLADPSALRHPEAREVWIGMVWSRLGRGDLAWAWWDTVALGGLQPWVAAERGRVLRELGLHEQAEALEADGLERADDLVDVVMLRLGLAADAVGTGRLDTAADRLTSATTLLATLPLGPRVARQRLRAAWVGLEVALLQQVPPPEAVLEGLARPGEDGTPVLPDEHRHGTTFHRAKSLLFGAVAHGSTAEADRMLELAADLAPPALRWAVELARMDAGHPSASPRARTAWAEVVPPAHVAREVAEGPVAERLGGPPGTAVPGVEVPPRPRRRPRVTRGSARPRGDA